MIEGLITDSKWRVLINGKTVVMNMLKWVEVIDLHNNIIPEADVQQKETKVFWHKNCTGKRNPNLNPSYKYLYGANFFINTYKETY